MSPDRVAELTQEVDRLTRGLVNAHYHLAERLHEADTTWLLYYLDGLLGDLSPEDAAERARERARERAVSRPKVEIVFTHKRIEGDCEEAEREIASLRTALAAATEREQAYRAALEMAERNTVYEIVLTSYPPGTVRMCRICDQSGPVHGPAIDHAPDCPFAVLAAGGPADGRGEG